MTQNLFHLYKNLNMAPTTLMGHYSRSPRLITFTAEHSLSALEFEKKICRSSFRKEFGDSMPTPARVRMSVGLLDKGPNMNSSRWSSPASFQKKRGQPLSAAVKTPTGQRGEDEGRSVELKELKIGKQRDESKKQLMDSGVQLLSSDWLLELLIDQIKGKRSVRAVINTQMRDVEVFMNQLRTRSSSPVVGVRMTATGRLGRRKKAMAQQMTRSLGKVPLGTFKQKVDYSQGFVVTKFGIVGLKVWISYAS